MFEDESNCAMNPIDFKKARETVKGMVADGWTIEEMCACIYDLWSDYCISEEQEEELYFIADPTDELGDIAPAECRCERENPLNKVNIWKMYMEEKAV